MQPEADYHEDIPYPVARNHGVPWLELIWVDSGYNARRVQAAVAKVRLLRLQIVKRSDNMKGFVILPRRWVVERTFSWFGRNKRWAEDFENFAETPATFLTPAPIQLPPSLARAQVVTAAMMEVRKRAANRPSSTP